MKQTFGQRLININQLEWFDHNYDEPKLFWILWVMMQQVKGTIMPQTKEICLKIGQT
jgi:hypothetical protein